MPAIILAKHITNLYYQLNFFLMTNFIFLKRSFPGRVAFWLLMAVSSLALAQPTVKVPPGCVVVVTGSGPGVAPGPGGVVGSGGIVVMPDPFDIAGAGGNFTLIPNGTIVTSWGLRRFIHPDSKCASRSASAKCGCSARA